ncbi:TPA: site-2 protease family protein [candidate division WWE3 bacterium]|uniref:Peptidase M50 domain-containing protein n=5 Tax=Katanobacteria TaxID=422282 RepID=A0A1F4V2V2_UNCKA|nr:MAG: Conserved hypothetical membrane protein [candidate division WWE3 bacterium GW2011_GWA2_44_16]OGC51400.1 MAG: hypothetical protein A2709_00835 [candidate division WWE3 bacterium RIFCSPHIGHO2_01_FULL_43_9]HAZ29189.1 site-2 protease family protein [candidate division WWE3 bacterium]
MQGLINILLENPLMFVVLFLSLVLSIAIHEFSHAYIAHLLGDDTAKNLGRITLNPLAHLDPLGTLTLLFVGFGWGKPVPVNYYNLAKPKRDAALIALAGPASNFLLAVGSAGLLYVLTALASGSPLEFLVKGLVSPLIIYNLVLGVFNLLPLEPLDGFKVINGLLPPKLSVQWIQLAPYGIYILLFMVLTGLTSRVILPIVVFFAKVLGVA